MAGRERMIIKRSAVFVDPRYVVAMRECLVAIPNASDDKTAAAERDEAAIEMVRESDSRKTGNRK